MRATTVLLIALVAAACQLPAELFVVELSGDGVVNDLPVTVEDRTDRVLVVGPAQAGQFNLTEGVQAHGPSTLAVTWMGGSCDDGAHLTLDERDGVYSILVTTRRSAGVCDLAGVLRTVTIGFDGPVDPEAVILRQQVSTG